MDYSGMNMFLSTDNIKRHYEQLKTMKLRFSILEKSLPQLEGREMGEIMRMKIDKELKNEALSLLWNIKSHELFFLSFTDIQSGSKRILKRFSSKEKFLYDLLMASFEKEYGFLYIFLNKKDEIVYHFANSFDGAFVKYVPILALDLYEHTYFSDYGFDKRRFLTNALAHLNLSSLDN